MTPPTLPGEVWRGNIDGPVCVTLRASLPVARAWSESSKRWRHVAAYDGDHAANIFAAWALSLRADAQRAAEGMRERCADVAVTERADRWDDRDCHRMSEDIERKIRALPATAPPLTCPDRLAAGTPYPDHRGRWGIDMHVARAWAEARGYEELSREDLDEAFASGAVSIGPAPSAYVAVPQPREPGFLFAVGVVASTTYESPDAWRKRTT